MVIMSASDEDILSDLLQCSICMEAFQTSGVMQPKMLPCQHSFDILCLRKISTRSTIQCPVCRRQHLTEVEGLTNNLTLMQVIDTKGPTPANTAHRPDSKAQSLGSEGSLQNLYKCYKTPSKVRSTLKSYIQGHDDKEFEADHLSAILHCMDYYKQVGDAENIDIIINCLELVRSQIQKAGSRLLNFQKLIQCLIQGVLDVMNLFKRRSPIQACGIRILRYLAVPKVLSDFMLAVCKTTLQALNTPLEREEITKAMEVMNILIRELPREQNSGIGSRANMKSILEILKKELSSTSSTTALLYMILSALTSLTDETPSTSLNIVKENGLEALQTLFRKDSITQEAKATALILLCNLAEVNDALPDIIRYSSMIEVLKQSLMSQNRTVSFMSGCAIANLSVLPKREWTRLCGDGDLREDLLQKLYIQVSAWKSAEGLDVQFRSLRPFYPLLQMFASPPTQLFAAWTIRSFCHHDKKKYQEMIIKEEALDILIDIKENRYADANVRKLVGETLHAMEVTVTYI